MRKGILLAGGAGTRLRPLTDAVSKQLLPVYDKPMVYYPLWTLLASGVREVAVITAPDQADAFKRVLGDGSSFGCTFTYFVQDAPKGIAQALTITGRWLRGEPSVLALGDNLLYGHGLAETLKQVSGYAACAVFGYPMADPRAYGVVEMHPTTPFIAVDVVEKPARPRSNLAVPGVYFLPPDAPAVAGGLTPSARGELEITDVLRHYIHKEPERGVMVGELKGGVAWFDCGTHDSLLDAANFVAAVTKRQGIKVCDPREFSQG